MSKSKEIYFICKKCGHQLWMDFKLGYIQLLLTTDCPNCGEEPDENWTLGGLGKSNL